MVIGVDAGMLGANDTRLKVGVWRVAINLLRALAQKNTSHTFRLYSFTPIPKSFMHDLGEKFENRVLTPSVGWHTVRLTLELAVRPVDVYLGLAQAMPRARCRKIGFVYDLGFLSHPEVHPKSAHRLARQTMEVVKRSDVVVTISHAIAHDLSTVYGKLVKNIVVAYPGVSDEFRARGKTYKSEVPYFFYSGSLKPGKNISTLIKAFAKVLKVTGKKYQLLLAGSDYWYDSTIRETIQKYGLHKLVKQLGFVSDAGLASYYRGAVAFVSPSLVEGFCLPAVEAMACGCPVVVSDIPALSEIVDDAGILVPPKSSDALARAMIKMDQAKVRTMYKKRGLAYVTRYNWADMASAVYKLL